MMEHVGIRVPLLLQARLSGHGAQAAPHGTVIDHEDVELVTCCKVASERTAFHTYKNPPYCQWAEV